jgi:hypothetical protein
MRIVALVLTIALLSGCANLSSSKFDVAEYANFVQFITAAEQARDLCQHPEPSVMARAADSLERLLHFQLNYVTYRPNNEATISIVDELHNNSVQLRDRYLDGTPSRVYCETKIDVMVAQAKIGIEAANSKLRK